MEGLVEWKTDEGEWAWVYNTDEIRFETIAVKDDFTIQTLTLTLPLALT